MTKESLAKTQGCTQLAPSLSSQEQNHWGKKPTLKRRRKITRQRGLGGWRFEAGGEVGWVRQQVGGQIDGEPIFLPRVAHQPILLLALPAFLAMQCPQPIFPFSPTNHSPFKESPAHHTVFNTLSQMVFKHYVMGSQNWRLQGT